MEIHAHSHAERKKWTHYLWEFLMLFLAVSLGFYAENLREGMIHKEQVKTNMLSLLSDLRSDLQLFDSVIDRTQYSVAMADSLIDLLHNDLSNTTEIYFTARSVTSNVGYYYTNSKSFEQMKSSGLLRFVSPKDLLDSIGNYYASFVWLANQTDLVRMKLDAVHKGNNALFDSYVFQQMMKLNFKYLTSKRLIINKPEGHPVLLSTDKTSINSVSLNYHYYTTTVKFYNNTAIAQRQRAERLIQLIKKEYRLE